LLDYWPLHRLNWPPAWRAAKPLLLEKIPLLALSVVASMLTFAAQRSFGAVAGLKLFSPATRVANAVCAYIAYIGQSILPANLAALYPAIGQTAVEAIPSAILLLAITAAALHFGKRRPYLLTGWLWYIVMLAPVIGIVHVGSQSRADRYMYVPLVGLSIAAVWMVADWADSRPRFERPLAAAAGLLLLLYGGLAYRQTAYWRDSHTLFEHTLSVTTDNPIIQNNLGIVLYGERNYAAAAEHYRQAFTISSTFSEAHYNLGLTLAAMSQFAAAVAQYRDALAIEPDYAEAHANLGHELMRSGQFDAAGKELEAALRLKFGIPLAQADLGLFLASHDDYPGAAQHLLEASRLAPHDATNEGNLCFVLAHLHRADAALTHCNEAVTLNPNSANAHFNLASSLALKGRSAEARAEFAETLRLDPAQAEARRALAEMADK
jgi:tetratricopeptide (TPR) repeat protein